MAGASRTNYLGFPELPYRIVSILIPQGEAVSAFSLEGGTIGTLAEGVDISLFEGEYLDDGTVRGLSIERSEIVGEGAVYPIWDVRHLGTRILRGYSIASFAVYPVKYDMETRTLTVRRDFDLVVETASAMETGTTERLRHIDGFRENTRREVESLVVNPGETSSYLFNEVEVDGGDRGFLPSYLPSMEGSEVAYLIVTNEAMKPAFQTLADWKTKKGIPTVVRTVEWIGQNYWKGADLAETIRNFIAEAYSKWGVEYVLLGGDTDVIPARFAYVAFYTGEFLPTDMYYSCLDGTWNADGDSIWGEAYHSIPDPGDEVDLYSEVYVGRMPVSTLAEANTLIGKSISYETPDETASKTQYLLCGEVIFPSNYVPGMEIITDGAEILEDIYTPYLSANPDASALRLYETYTLYPGSLQLSVQSAIAAMNEGANHFIHAGHGNKYNMSVGNGSILNYDAANLSNGDKLFSMYLMNCTNVAFDTDCLAEYFLLNQGGGAFAVTGSSRSAFPSTSRPYMDNYYYELFNQDMVQLGKLYTKSREQFTPGAIAETADRWTHFIINYLGDPELCMYRGTVKTFEVSHPSYAVFGDNDITVTVNSGGAPCDSAFVCLYKDGDDYAFGRTGPDGRIVFSDFLCRDTGQIQVAVTGIDHARYTSSITVSQKTEAYLRVNKYSVADGSGGNGDDVLDSGETVEFSVKLENTGNSTADKVYAILRSGDPYVTMIDSVSIYPVIASGQILYGLDPFGFSVDEAAADQHVIEFSIDVRDSTGGAWTETFAVEAHAPGIELYVNTVSDAAPWGDGDGIIEAGENFLLNTGIKNFGTGTATGLEGHVTSYNDTVVVTDPVSMYGDLSLLEIGYGDGFVLSESEVDSSNYFDFDLTDTYGRVYSRRMELRRPGVPGTITLDGSYGPTEIHATWHAPDKAEDYRYLVYHSLDQGGPYEQASVDLLLHSLFRDTGLLTSTVYYYVITAVDSCGNQSVYSAEHMATTSPPQLVGWPNMVSKESSSSPKLGDIDGDTHVDVVVGSDYVHAWHGNGIEIRDGDGQPLSWGILNTDGTTFTATVALGNLDGEQGLEIVAAAWDTKRIYVFKADGTILPGFPKTTVDICWASPALGDFDGDGDLEIVAYDFDGTVYIWHHDGTEFLDGDSNPATDGPFFKAGLPSQGLHVSTPAMADMDDDGIVELIVCAPSDSIHCLNADRSRVPGWPVDVASGSNISASPAIGDIDGDGRPELVVQTSGAMVYGLNHDGTSMPGWPKWVNSSTFFHGSPALGDLDGDGRLEVAVPGQNGYLYIFRYNGAALTGWPKQYSTTGGTESSPIIADVTGDGALDIIMGAENGKLFVWNADGSYVPGFPIQLSAYVRGTPTVGDLDRDGDTELVVSCWNQYVYVWDLEADAWYGYAPWNGFHGNVLNNGWIDHVDLTGAEGIACAYQLYGGSLMLNWSVITGVDAWDLYRKEGAGEYELLAAGLQADPSGIVAYSDVVIEEGLVYSYRLQASSDARLYAEAGDIRIPVGRARLYQNYPNPFNPVTRIAYTVPGGVSSKNNVLLAVYDVRGALVKTLVNSPVPGGRHVVEWDGRNNNGDMVASGVYFSRLSAGGVVDVKKMVLLR
jgi:hypothetical protein